MEKYFTSITNFKSRITMTRFRCSAHSLQIEVGRHRNIVREDRKCLVCNLNVIENEFHFLLVCPFYRDIRTLYLPKYYYTWPNIQKFIGLMESNSKKTILNISKFLDKANSRRNHHFIMNP